MAITHRTLYHSVSSLLGKRFLVWELTFKLCGTFAFALDCVSDHKTIYYYTVDFTIDQYIIVL